MTPLGLYAVIAAFAAFSLHKRWYGALLFAGALLVWLVLMQLIIAYEMHPGLS